MDNNDANAKALTAQQLADQAERAAIEHYLALRAVFWPGWGVNSARKETR